ncbi:MAG TPA: hypothetical protein VEK73_11140 [Xanthobacteraceae bacterium]|nr:hypothetical protein [Xanthobacteraceae bacterium]
MVKSIVRAAKGPVAEPTWIMIGDRLDLGVIDAVAATAVGCVAAPIRLPEGFESQSKGHGLLHIQGNARRMAMIKGLGIATAAQFVAQIAANWTKIVRANEVDRLVLVQSVPGYDLRIVVKLYVQGGKRYWSTVTAIPGRKVKPEEVLYEKTVG